MIDPDAPNSADDAVGPVVESFLARFRRGERPALTELIACHPVLAEQLLEIIPALVELEQLGDLTGSFRGSRRIGIGSIEGDHPSSLGDYRILRRIGGGGMGVVYEAEHESLKSRVALKVMHPRFRADEKYLRRFHIEAQSAAGLHHTNIVSVFDYGEQGGVCFYAMQYIQGQPLDSILADLRRLRTAGGNPHPPDPPGPEPPTATRVLESVAQGLMTGRFVAGALPDRAIEETRTIEGLAGAEPGGSRDSPTFGSSSLGGSVEGRYYREVARVSAQVADALEHAHRAGVLHRDIKPSNLLLDASGNVWVTDFGLAKLVEGEDVSQSQDLIGTLRFMAPERFRGISNQSGDIYALGATLYELLTLRPAFDGTDQVRLIDRIIHDPPERPRLIDRQIPRDLETIVLKALAKDPKDRFRSAREFAEELRRFAGGHPTRSRPISSVERFWRWCKRDPWLAVANVAAAVLTTVLAIGSLSSAYVYKNQVVALEDQRTRKERALLDAYIAQADAGRFSHRPGQRFKSLQALSEASRLLDGLANRKAAARSRESLRDLAIAALALPDLRVARTFGSSSEKTRFLDIDPAFERYVTSDDRGRCVMVRVDTGDEVFRFPNPGQNDDCLPLFGPRGKVLVLMVGDGTLQVWRLDGPTPSLLVDKPAGSARPGTVNFRDDGSALVFVTPDGQIVMVDTESGAERVLPSEERKASQVAFDPDGRRLVVVSEFGAKIVAEVRTPDDPRPTASIDLSTLMSGVDWSPDGHRVAMAGKDRRIYLWEPDRSAGSALVLSGLNGGGLRVSFNHRGDLLASQGDEGMLRLWDPRTGRQLLNIHTYANPRFSIDDRSLGIGRAGQNLQTFEVASGRELRTFPGDPAPDQAPGDLSFEPDGRILAARTKGGVKLWDSEAVELLDDLTELGWSSTRFEDNGTLLTFGLPGLIRWPIRREGPRHEMGPPQLVRDLKVNGANLSTSSDGKTLLLTWPGNSATLLSGEPPGRLTPLSPQNDVRWGSLSPDGRWAATTSFNGPEVGLAIWDVKTGRRVTALNVPNRSSVQFSPDGRWLATSQNSCKLWEVGTWRFVRQIDVDSGNIAFSHDGSTLAICVPNQVLLHDPVTGRRLATLEAPNQGPPSFPTFTRVGDRLALADAESHGILIWDLRLIRSELANMGLDWETENPSMTVLKPPSASPPSPIRLVVTSSDEPDDAEKQAREHERNDAHFNKVAGINAYETGDDSRAIAFLSRAVELAPNDPEALNSLAWALVNTVPEKRDPARARPLAERAIKVKPNHLDFRNTLVLALFRLGLDNEAVAMIEAAPQHVPWDDLAIAPCYFRLGKPRQAREAQASALKWRSSSSTLTPREAADFRALAEEVEAILSGPAKEACTRSHALRGNEKDVPSNPWWCSARSLTKEAWT